ncbi:TetR/AcrR family transcriptional regulator [Nonomuraea endophytica]|uniref:AcrR family transcriptional regulator n=1 Tax=Nonomuraea endophytica TaxID=714136 RepID=A0A7W8EI68_9ACTN|nr:TetR/AcrR family transcriptional regulator [Nonomuraea endophytica]MBB5080334.1 AcrR family transcriptional regulator [Nonomuraea endophytica]
MTRRTQAERSDTTTSQLISAARKLFGEYGYAATSIDAVAATAGVTKGAAYHHFAGKPGLFRAAFTREQEEIATRLEEVGAASPDPWTALRDGCRTFLEHCLDPGFRRIVLLDAPSVLGWEEVRQIQHAHTLRVLLNAMRATDETLPADTLAIRGQLMFGALCEAGMLLARSPDPTAALPPITIQADHLLTALHTP